MSTARNIFITKITQEHYLLITSMHGRNRAYWTLVKGFPQEHDVNNCLSYGEGLPEGGIDEVLEDVFKALKKARKGSYKLDEVLTAAKL